MKTFECLCLSDNSFKWNAGEGTLGAALEMMFSYSETMYACMRVQPYFRFIHPKYDKFRNILLYTYCDKSAILFVFST